MVIYFNLRRITSYVEEWESHGACIYKRNQHNILLGITLILMLDSRICSNISCKPLVWPEYFSIHWWRRIFHGVKKEKKQQHESGFSWGRGILLGSSLVQSTRICSVLHAIIPLAGPIHIKETKAAQLATKLINHILQTLYTGTWFMFPAFCKLYRQCSTMLICHRKHATLPWEFQCVYRRTLPGNCSLTEVANCTSGTGISIHVPEYKHVQKCNYAMWLCSGLGAISTFP